MSGQKAAPFKAVEAFCLMWYACDCGHRERFWNSRAGVTPYCTSCPSCGEPSLRHVDFSLDVRAPDHKPHNRQSVWLDMTKERAEACARRYVASIPDHVLKEYGRTRDQVVAGVAASNYESFGVGTSPDFRIHGYEQKS